MVGARSWVRSMALNTSFEYEEHFVAFIDFLGFTEAIATVDDERRTKLLRLLVALSELQTEFTIETQAAPGGVATEVAPNITTFSDNMVISYPLEKIRAKGYYDATRTPLFIMDGFARLISWLAIAALRIGFLIRGGAAIGRLFHYHGVVYGEGMLEAYRIENQVSVYPRIVLSDSVIGRPAWNASPKILTDVDGLRHVDYFSGLFLNSVVAPDGYVPTPAELYTGARQVISSELKRLKVSNQQRAFAKWTWFERQVSEGLTRIGEGDLKRLGVCL